MKNATPSLPKIDVKKHLAKPETKPVAPPLAAPANDPKTLKKIETCLAQLETARIDLTADYNDWAKLGFSFASLGMGGAEYFHRVSSMNDGYNREACQKQFDECLKRYDGQVMKADVGTFFFYCQQHGVSFAPAKVSTPNPGARPEPPETKESLVASEKIVIDGDAMGDAQRVATEILPEQTEDSLENEDTDDEEKGGIETATDQIRAYLRARFDFRYNVVKDSPEWRKRGVETWTELDDYRLNTLLFAMEKQGIKCSAEKLSRLLKSSFVPLIDPISSYFNGLRKLPPTGTKYIEQLADTVKVANPTLWLEYLTKWLVATVANATTPKGCQNHTCLVLTGEQGKYKTTWLTHLCPPELSEYIFTGKINLENKDAENKLSEFLFINIDDQLRNLNRKDENGLKTLITQDSVKNRKAYARFETHRPRRASFMGSINGNDFLTDPTGSRRFLPFEALDIHIDKMQGLNVDGAWAEAVRLYQSGMVYWFSGEELEKLYENNEAYQVHSEELELLLTFYEPANKRNAQLFLTATEILSRLQGFTTVKLNTKKLGEALTKCKFEKTSKRLQSGSMPLNVYPVNELSSNERDERARTAETPRARPVLDVNF